MKKLQKITLFFLMVLTFILTSFGFSSCTTPAQIASIDPGLYIFDERSYDIFVGFKMSSEKKQEFSSPQTNIHLSGKILPKVYVYQPDEFLGPQDYKILHEYYFEDCTLEVEFTANGVTEVRTFYLSTRGEQTFDVNIEVPVTYEAKTSYKVIGGSGYVFAEIYTWATFEYKGYEYEYWDYAGAYFCRLKKSPPFFKNTIHLYDYVYNPDGQLIPYRIRGEMHLSSLLGKTLILDGDFYLDDLSGLLSSLKDNFPNLETVAIKNLYAESTFDITVNLPETGVTFYLNDHTGFFTQKLENTYFVNGIKSFSEFDLEKYN